MAKLRKCETCDIEISTKAESCPHCGEPSPKKTSLLVWIMLFFILFFMLMMSIASEPINTSSNKVSNKNKEYKVDIELENYFEQNKENKRIEKIEAAKLKRAKRMNKIRLEALAEKERLANRSPHEKKVEEEVEALISTAEKISHTKVVGEKRKKMKKKLMIEYSKTDLDHILESVEGLSKINKFNSYKSISLKDLNIKVKNLRQFSGMIKSRKDTAKKNKKLYKAWEKANKFRIKVQKKHFPKMRDALGPLMREKMWEYDTDVRTIGKGYRRMVLTSTHFASNSNIKTSRNTINLLLHDYRFKRVDFKWMKSASEWTYYTIDSLNDYD